MDKYDKAIAYLIEHPSEVEDAWNRASCLGRHPHGCLFLHCNPRGFAGSGSFGCLIQVKAGTYPAFTPELTEKIRADERIPSKPDDIKPTLEGLTPFAEYQREMDRTIRTVPNKVINETQSQ